MVGATIVSALAFTAPIAGLVVMALAVAGYAMFVDDVRAALATGAVGYLLFDGFLVNRYGDLTWPGTTSLVAFVLAVVLGVGLRWLRHTRTKESPRA